MELISRKDAAETFKHLYFTGEPCKHGHIAPRYTHTCVCSTCHKEKALKARVATNIGFMGYVPFKVPAHRDDHKALRDYAVMLAAARGVKLPDEVARDQAMRMMPTAPITPTQANPTNTTQPRPLPNPTAFVSPFQHKLDELARHQEQLEADKIKRANYIPAEARAFTGDAK